MTGTNQELKVNSNWQQKGIFTDDINNDMGTLVKYNSTRIVVENEAVWGVDIDDTLLLWDVPKEGPMVTFTEPHTKDSITVPINENNIRLLKEKKARGAYIILWSQGGWEYAKTVADALGLHDYIDLIMTKPIGIIDDLEAHAWMPKAVNIPHTKNYKK